MEKIIRELKLARGILLKEGKILLVRCLLPGHGHFFLPGGTVEPGEAIRSTLVREWQEELGWKISAGDFLGCLEANWQDKRKSDGALVDVVEVNFLFRVDASPELLGRDPVSIESHLEFSWVSLARLEEINLLPAPLKGIIPRVAAAREPIRAVWESTL